MTTKKCYWPALGRYPRVYRYLPIGLTLALVIQLSLFVVFDLPLRPHFLFETAFPVQSPLADVLVILKSGYGNRHRLPTSISVLSDNLDRQDDLLIVADYEGTVQDDRGAIYPVHDVIAGMESQIRLRSGSRMDTYRALQIAIMDAHGDEVPDEITLLDGWAVDQLKNLPGFELALRQYGRKEWFLMVDDDTYVHFPSLLALTHRTEHELPRNATLYLGKFLDSEPPWAHGGSGILVNRNALVQLFDNHPGIALQFFQESLTAQYGDQNFGKALAAADVPAWMPAHRYFNGEPPDNTRVRTDRLCQPLVTFHHLSEDELLRTRARIETAGQADTVVTWYDPWRWGGPPINSSTAQSRVGWNYITSTGRHDEQFDLGWLGTLEDCRAACGKQEQCLAWLLLRGHCRGAPWFGVGHEEQESISGVMSERIQKNVEEQGCAA
jgi:hypothetical protein